MNRSQIVALLVYAVILFIYLFISSKEFTKGWVKTGVPVKGGKLNGLLFIALCTIVLILILAGIIHF